MIWTDDEGGAAPLERKCATRKRGMGAAGIEDELKRFDWAVTGDEGGETDTDLCAGSEIFVDCNWSCTLVRWFCTSWYNWELGSELGLLRNQFKIVNGSMGNCFENWWCFSLKDLEFELQDCWLDSLEDRLVSV